MGASILLRAHAKITKDNWLDDMPISDQHTLNGWNSMKRLLANCSKRIMVEEASQKLLTGEMGRAMLSRLDPGSTLFWHLDDGEYHRSHARFHLPLLTNP